MAGDVAAKVEIDNEHMEELTQLETVQRKGKDNDEIEFDKIKVSDLAASSKNEYRRIPVPRHRMTPLRQNWDSLLKTLVEHMKLQVRMNTKRHAVELKVINIVVNYVAVAKRSMFCCVADIAVYARRGRDLKRS